MPKFLIMLAEVDHFRKWDEADDAAAGGGLRGLPRVQRRGQGARHDRRRRGPESPRHRTHRAGRRAGRARSTDGPYAETVEQVGGFYVIDVADLDTAVELAGLLPVDYDLEVRECLDVDVS